MFRKFLLSTTALCVFACPTVATAEPVSAFIFTTLASAGVAVGTATFIAAGLTNLLISAAISFGVNALTGGPKSATQQDIKRELSAPQSKPPKRFIYGHYKAVGSPAPLRVKGDFLYMCLLLNSRESQGNPTIYFDGREAAIESGDLFNFAGGGAVLTPIEEGQSFGGPGRKPKAWMGLGDQTAAPAEIVADLGGDIFATDAWRGCTVLWLKIDAGPNEQRIDTWPRTPPEVEVLADWSKVYDPRNPAHNPTDRATWAYSNNQALCLLDALRFNPIRSRRLDLLRIDSFIDGANVADQSVGRFHVPGNVPRYTTNGVLIWRDAELMDQIAPLVDAGGGDLMQIGGKLAYVAPTAKAPVYIITEILEEGGFEFKRLLPGSQIPTAIAASYVAPDRGWQDSDIPALAVGIGFDGFVDEGIATLPLPFVTEATQAMRIQKIVRNRAAAQRRLSVTLPPDAIKLAAGSIVDWGIPELPRCNGLWRVVSINPSLWLSGQGVAFRCSVTLEEEPANIDAWNPAVDEFQLATETFTPPAPVRNVPGDLQATTGPGVAIGDTARVRFSFLPVLGNVVGYEWQWRLSGQSFGEGGTIGADVRDTAGRVFGFLVPVMPGLVYDIRVRTIYFGAVSDWTMIVITALGPEYDLDPPAGGTATGGAGQIEASFITPNNADFRAIQFWASDTDNSSVAELLMTVFSAPNTVQTIIETDLGDDQTRYYFALSQGPMGAVSAFSASVSATTDP